MDDDVDASHSPACGVVVVNYRSAALTVEAVEPLIPYCRVVVVDNTESPGDRAFLESRFGGRSVKLVFPDKNLGFAGGVNEGALALKSWGCEEVLLLNPDARLDWTSLEHLRRHLASEPLLGGLSPTIREGSWLIRGGGRASTWTLNVRPWVDPHKRIRLTYLHGACSLYRMVAFLDVGGMDSSYFMFWEDVDLGDRLLDAGWYLGYCEHVLIDHEAHATTGEGSPAARRLYYESATVYWGRRHKVLAWLVAMRGLLAAARSVRGGDRVGARAVVQGLRGGLSKRGRAQRLMP